MVLRCYSPQAPQEAAGATGQGRGLQVCWQTGLESFGGLLTVIQL